MNTERDKRIAEALGLCWHELVKVIKNHNTKLDIYEETHHHSSTCHKCKLTNAVKSNFSTFDGMGLILQKGPEREWWIGFAIRIFEMFRTHPIREVGQINADGVEGILILLQDPDHLANELYTFLKEDKDEG